MDMQQEREKEKILNGAQDLFRKFGVRSVTMDDIAHHLAISKKTIYLYFKDKDNIIGESVMNFLHLERERISRVEKLARNPVELILLLNECIRESLKDVSVTLLYDLQKYHSSAWKLIEDFRYGFMLGAIIRNIQWGIEEGVFRDDIQPEIVGMMRLEQATLAHNDHVFPRHQYSLMTIQKQFFEHFIQGLLSEKGRKLLKKQRGTSTKASMTTR